MDGSPTVLPAGSYKAYSMALVASGASRRTAWLDYLYTDPFTIEPGQTRTLEIGGKVRLDIAPGTDPLVLTRGAESGVIFRLMLPKGEITRVNNPRTLGAPEFTLKDASGKAVYTGAAGLADYYRDMGYLPQSIKPGDYAAEASFDLGEFGGIIKSSRKVTVR
jgi:hypothetical protein